MEVKCIEFADTEADAIFIGVPKGKSVSSCTPNDLLRMKLENGLAILCWHDSQKAAQYFSAQPPIVSDHMEIGRATRDEFLDIWVRARLNESDIDVALMDTE